MTTLHAEIGFKELQEEREFRRCCPQSRDPEVLLEGFLYFCENYAYIKHPERGRILFKLFDAQRETAAMWVSERYSLMLKARQIGFSTLIAVFVFWLTFFYPDRSIIMLSRTERDAIKLLAKSKYTYRFLPEWMKFRGPPMNMTQTKLEFSNESYVESLPSASDPARGESVYLAVIDELAFLPNSEEAYAAIEPVADVGGRIIALSTANGEGNLFHSLWVGATTKSNRFKTMFHPWWSNGRDQAWYDAKAAELPEWQMAQEYPDNPDEAFLKSGRPVFSLQMLREVQVSEPISRGQQLKHYSWDYREDGHGPLSIWEYPTEESRYCIGADVSEGLEHGDYSSAHVINARTGDVVAAWHGRVDPDLFGTDVLAPLGRWYRSALIGVESNNHGLTTLKALQRVRYPVIYMQRSPRYKRSVPTDILGWRTTQISKPLAVDELNQNLRDGTVHLFDEATVAELRTYVRDDAGRMSGSPFDDRTMSLSIANQMLKHVNLPQYQVDQGPKPGTFADYEKRFYGFNALDRDPRGRSISTQQPDPIGKHAVRRSGAP